MNELRTTDRRNQALAWGAILIAVGAVNLIPAAPRGAGLLAIGAVLLGLNLTRLRSGIALNGISLALGAACLLSGAAALLKPAMGYGIEVPFLPALLVAVGVVLMAGGSRRKGPASPGRDGSRLPESELPNA